MNRPKLLAVATFALLAATLPAQQSLLPYLPKDTIIAASAPNLAAAYEQFQSSPVAKMWREEEMQTFLADALELAKEQFEQFHMQAKEAHAQGEFPIDPDQLLELRVGGVTYAVTRLGIDMGNEGPLPNIGIVLHLDFGTTPEIWTGLLQMGMGMLEGAAGNEMAKVDSKVGQVALTSFQPLGAPEGLEMSLNVAMVPNGVLIGTLESDVRTILENMQAKTPGLGANPLYARLADRVQAKGAALQSFVHIDPIIEFGLTGLGLATQMVPELGMIDLDGVDRALVAMGMRQLGAAAGSGAYVDGKCIMRSCHSFGVEGLTAAGGKNVDMGFLKWVPKDAVGFSAWTWDVASFYDTVLKGLQAYDPQVAEQALGKLAQIEEQLGFRIRDDLFGSFGDHGFTWSMPASNLMSMPETAMLFAVQNEEKLVTVLRNLALISNGMLELEEGERRGIKVYSIRANFDPTGGQGPNPLDMLAPSFAFKDGYLVAGFSVGDIKRVFKRMDREDDPSGDIRANKEFAAVAASIPANVASVSFTDWKTEFESIYQLATGALAMFPIGEDVPVDLSLLPEPGVLTQHLFGAISYSQTTGDGSETVSISPWGPEVVVGLMALAGAGAATFASMSRF